MEGKTQAQFQQFISLVVALEHTNPVLAGEYLQKVRQLYRELPEQASMLMFKMSDHIVKLKAVNEDIHWVVVQCVKDIIDMSIQSEYKIGCEAMRQIFDTNFEYYRTNNLDQNLKYPLGINRKLNQYQPEVGDQCDVVKPYITSTSFCSWVRCTVLAKQAKKYTIKYQNSEAPITLKDMPHFATLGSHTSDYNWRVNLDIGSPLDSFNKVWYSSTIVQVLVENGVKKVRVSFRRFHENGEKMDSDGNKYDGLGPNEDQWFDVFSCKVQMPGKMAKKLCYYSHISEESMVDDTYDLLFQKQYEEEPFHGIMRLLFTRSLSFLQFFQYFCEKGGYEAYLKLLKEPDANAESIFNMMIVIGNTSFLVPRMGIQRYFPQILNETINYVKNNFKILNPFKIDMLHYLTDTLGKRLYSLSEKHRLQHEIKKFLILEFLKLNMEKQMIALKLLYELIRPTRPYMNQIERKQLEVFMRDHQIFYKIIQNNVHEQILSRCVELLRYFMESKIIGWPEIEYIWNIVPHSDQRGRATIQKLIGDISNSKDFAIEYVQSLLDKILSIKETDISIDKLNLLRTLKDKELSFQYKTKILNYLWDCITVKSINIKPHIEEQMENVFRGFINTLKETSIRIILLKMMIERLVAVENIKNQIHLLKYYILTYGGNQVKGGEEVKSIVEEQYEGPTNIPEVVQYLKSLKIYQTLLTILTKVKTKDKIEGVLEFIEFLFQEDKNDVSEIVKAIYDILGPSDIFLLWAKNFTHRAIKFFIDLLDKNLDSMQKFQNLSFEGFQAIKVILFDINISEGNLKILKKKKGISVETSTNAESTEKKMGPVEKQESLVFVYVLKSPFECRGMQFLLKILEVAKSTKVYEETIKLIIQFITNLDERILVKTKSFREQFLNKIFMEIKETVGKKCYSQVIKQRFSIYLNLIDQLFFETEKHGMEGLEPHFTTIEGELMTFKIENNFAGNNIFKNETIPLTVNENCTLWNLKEKLSEIYKEDTQKIDVYRYNNRIEQCYNGRRLTDLVLFHDQVLKIQKAAVKDVPRCELLNQEGDEFSQKFNPIAQKWFHSYKNSEDVLTAEEFKKLSKDQWKNALKATNNLEEYLKIHQRVDLHLFKQFLHQFIQSNLHIVWRMINLAGYKNNLEPRGQKHRRNVNIEELPRKILSCQAVYEIIFKLLSEETFSPLHLQFYKLLSSLQTYKELHELIQQDVKPLLESQTSIYKESYIVETILTQLKRNSEFGMNFYTNGGHRIIYKKLISIIEKEDLNLYKVDELQRTILIPNMLKILNSFLWGVLHEEKIATFIRKNKINTLQIEELEKKIQTQKKNESEGKDLEIQQISYKNVASLEQIREDAQDYLLLSQRMLQNLILKYENDYLIKITLEVFRMYSSLALVSSQINFNMLILGVKNESLNIRRGCQNTIFLALIKNQNICKEMLEFMLKEMPMENKGHLLTYFILMGKILQKCFDLNAKIPGIITDEYLKLFTQNLISKMLNVPNETRTMLVANKILHGLLNLIKIVLSRSDETCKSLMHFKQEIIHKCLYFYQPKERIQKVEIKPELLVNVNQPEIFDDYVKCKTDDTRKVLMEIIYYLHKHDTEQNRALFFQQFIWPIFNEFPQSLKRTSSKTMHVGLNNLGSTCYMNSMLQVLNAIDPFRNALMKADVEHPVVKELKALFSYLFFSERVDYVPKNLLNAFVPAINPGIQQDTTQFLNYLFDQIEYALKNSPYKKLLEQLFKGNQVAQMICHTCGAKREREEQFFCYAVDIDGKYQLQSALEGMHSGQLITDCLCESCGNRSDTTKRNVLNQVPNIFFVHLKRIVFNYDVFINTKIHTRLEFPNQLNFQPYTKEGLELREQLGVQYMKKLAENQQEKLKFQELALHGKDKDFYNLKLKGIIVHSGTPQVGHYYTILKKQNGWVKFDDARVSFFPISSFEEECYGGNWIADEWGGFGSSKNAYVLVYQKVKMHDIVIETIHENIKTEVMVPCSEFKTLNTSQWYKEVWLDNHNLMLEQHLISQNYCKDFLHFLTKVLEITPSEGINEIISQVLYKIIPHCGETGGLTEVFLKNVANINASLLDKYALADSMKTFNLLFHQSYTVRQFASIYLENVLLESYRKGDGKTRQKVMVTIQELLKNLHHNVAKNWLRIDGYLRLICRLVQNSMQFKEMYEYFVNAHLISYFIDFVMEKQSPIKIMPKQYSLGTKSNPVNFGYAISIIYFFLTKSYGFNGANYQAEKVSEEYLFHLSDNDVICLSHMPFYEKMIKEHQNVNTLSWIIQRLAILNLPFSHAISRVLLKCINEITDPRDSMQETTDCLTKLLTIRDAYWVNRAECVLGSGAPFIFDKNLLSNLQEEKYVYLSSLEDLFPIECLFSYAHINRYRNPFAVLHITKTILEACSVHQEAMHYLLKQPSPSYHYTSYVDWLSAYCIYLTNAIQTQSNQKIRNELSKKIQTCFLYIKDMTHLMTPRKTLILGRVGVPLFVTNVQEHTKLIQIGIFNVEVYGLESQPTGIGNKALDQYLTNGRLQKKVTPQSNILNIMKASGKPLAIKQKIEEEEDKEITSLFDEIPTSSHNQMVSEQPTAMSSEQPTMMASEQPLMNKEKFEGYPTLSEQKEEDKMVIQEPISKPSEEPDASKEMEEQPELINIAALRVYPDYLRKMEIVNKTQTSKCVKLTFHKNLHSNTILPHSLKIIVTNKSSEAIWYHKINPDEDWGQIQYEVEVEEAKDPKNTIAFFKLYGGQYPIKIETEEKVEKSDQNDKMDLQKEIMAQERKDDGMNEMGQAEINCPQCTFLNSISNQKCEVCDASLHGDVSMRSDMA